MKRSQYARTPRLDIPGWEESANEKRSKALHDLGFGAVARDRVLESHDGSQQLVAAQDCVGTISIRSVWLFIRLATCVLAHPG